MGRTRRRSPPADRASPRTLVVLAVLAMMPIALRAEVPIPELTGDSARRGLQQYLDYAEGLRFKLFALSADGAWSWYALSTYQEAHDRALADCASLTKTRRCELYAVGNAVVRGLRPARYQRTVDAYRSKQSSGPSTGEAGQIKKINHPGGFTAVVEVAPEQSARPSRSK